MEQQEGRFRALVPGDVEVVAQRAGNKSRTGGDGDRGNSRDGDRGRGSRDGHRSGHFFSID